MMLFAASGRGAGCTLRLSSPCSVLPSLTQSLQPRAAVRANPSLDRALSDRRVADTIRRVGGFAASIECSSWT
jgi:hypothetical protein